MSRKAGLRVGALIAAIALVMAVTAVAAGASGVAPTLGSPNHRQVDPGPIRLVVNVPLRPARHGVFITITHQRKLDRFGHLKECPGVIRCEFVEPTHWQGHKWSWVARFSFPGFFSVTPGKYYWQAHYYTVGDTAVYFSGIGSFTVR